MTQCTSWLCPVGYSCTPELQMLVVYMHTAPGGEYQLFHSKSLSEMLQCYHSASSLVTVLQANQVIPMSKRIFVSIPLMSTDTSLLLIYTSLIAWTRPSGQFTRTGMTGWINSMARGWRWMGSFICEPLLRWGIRMWPHRERVCVLGLAPHG